MSDSKAIGVAYRDQNLDGTTVGATMTAYGIESSTIHASQLTGNTVTASQITGNTISGNTVSGGTITGATISANTLGSNTVNGTLSGGTYAGIILSGTNTIGANATNLVGFFGAPATVQPTNASEAAAAATGAVSVSATQWGFSTSTQANAIVTLVNQLRADLVNLGVIKGS